MFREIKKEARKILFKNYKYFIFPTILHILTNCIISTCCYFIFYNDGLKNWSTPLFCFLILAVLISRFFLLPLADFLLFNTYSASIFMGDTGSLYLGGMIATISIFSSNTLFIPLFSVPLRRTFQHTPQKTIRT